MKKVKSPSPPTTHNDMYNPASYNNIIRNIKSSSPEIVPANAYPTQQTQNIARIGHGKGMTSGNVINLVSAKGSQPMTHS